ncbi:MAG TPA: hypothetical protein VHM65_08190, partial [Candidatus Lustribacter sp.]|nr:hypothetical protein [Candidatus Lustribacter sp.]
LGPGGGCSTTAKISLASAKGVGARKASLVQATTSAAKGELVVYSGGASGRAAPKLAYDILTVGVRADQTPSRLHTIVDANSGATLESFDEIHNGTGNGIFVGTVAIGTTAGLDRPTIFARHGAPSPKALGR